MTTPKPISLCILLLLLFVYGGDGRINLRMLDFYSVHTHTCVSSSKFLIRDDETDPLVCITFRNSFIRFFWLVHQKKIVLILILLLLLLYTRPITTINALECVYCCCDRSGGSYISKFMMRPTTTRIKMKR